MNERRPPSSQAHGPSADASNLPAPGSDAAAPLGAGSEVGEVRDLSGAQMEELIEAAAAAIRQDGGFGWLTPPPADTMRQYWRGVLLIPERRLFVARLDGAICGSVQLHFSSAQNEAQRLIGRLTTFFLAPWARGLGLGGALLARVEATASEAGLLALELNIRATQERARRTFAARGYRNWGVNPLYARVKGRWVAGYHYSLALHGGDEESEVREESGASGALEEAEGHAAPDAAKSSLPGTSG